MRTFLGVLGVFSLLGALGTFGNSMYVGWNAETVMQQEVGLQYLIYSGILLIAGIVGLGFSLEPTDICNNIKANTKAIETAQFVIKKQMTSEEITSK